MKALTPKEAREPFELLMAMKKLARVLDKPRKQPNRPQKAEAAAA